MSSSLGFDVVAIKTDDKPNKERSLVTFDPQYDEEDIHRMSRADAQDIKK